MDEKHLFAAICLLNWSNSDNETVVKAKRIAEYLEQLSNAAIVHGMTYEKASMSVDSAKALFIPPVPQGAW